MANSKNARSFCGNFGNNDQNFLQNGYAHSNIDVVISGISGAFPESDNVQELADNLFSKKDMVTDGDRRANPDFKNKYRIGKMKQLNKFDSDFFGMLPKQAEYLDPGSRIILEKVFEAIVDAGYNPKHFSGSNTAVFIGRMWAPMEAMLLETEKKLHRFSMDEGCASLIANRISFWLNVRGPSIVVDSACSSSLQALDLGVQAIKSGLCDAAIVGATNICLVPFITKLYESATMTSPEGICKSFDNAANGLTQSEAVSVILLQRKEDARRIYARVVHTKTNCDGYKSEGMHEPSSKMLTKLFKEFYEECQVEPGNIEFVEAHAAGTKAGDIAELKAMEEVFCRNRKIPLKIGSVKSNLGHAESASGLCSIFKVLISFEFGFLPPNLHFETPRARVNALKDGRMKVVTDLTPWDGTLTAINNIGFGATNSHALLEPNPKIKSKKTTLYECPLLVTISGCTENAVDTILKDLEEKPVDIEFVGLLHEIYKDAIPNHFYKGYIILQKEIRTAVRNIRKISGRERSIWFVFSGLGSQWQGMGKSLMKIPEIAKSIRAATQTLKMKNVDAVQIITETDSANLNDREALMRAYVGIVAIQIAFIDLLRKIGLKPDGFLGHSVGEISCAYLDGCVTAEEAMLLAYYRGLTVAQRRPVTGSMASVGLGYQKLADIKPAEIDIGCHNAADNCSISGPSDVVTLFIKTLRKNNVFVREIESCNIANHSRYNKNAALILDDIVKHIIKKPKLRSNKWISSTFLREDWATDASKYFSAEYFHQNIVGTVFFEEACYEIPNHAIVIEIAPHGLFQSILKRSLHETVTNIPLMSKHHSDNSVHVLNALGEVYMAGGNFSASKLYPPVDFPVSRGTRMISPLIRWNHEQDWHVFKYDNRMNVRNGTRRVVISLEDEEHKYLKDHVVEGQNLFPGAGYLVLAWETFALLQGKYYTDVPIFFEDVQILRTTRFSEQGSIEFIINLFKNKNYFQIMENSDIVASGSIRALVTNDIENIDSSISIPDDHDPNQLPLLKTDIKKEWKLRGYETKGIFPAVTYINQERTNGRILWIDNYVSFIDSLITIFALSIDVRNACVPSMIQKLSINPKAHVNLLETLDPENPEFVVDINEKQKKIKSGGLEMEGIEIICFAKREFVDNLLMKKLEFIPYVNPKIQDLSTIASICTHIVMENFRGDFEQIIELVDNFTNINETLMCQLLLDAFKNIPLVEPKISVSNGRNEILKIDYEIVLTNNPLPSAGNCTLIVASHVLQRDKVLQACLDSLKNQGFLLTREIIQNPSIFEQLKLSVCFDCSFDNEHILLLRKAQNTCTKKPIIIKVSNDSYSWISELQKYLDDIKRDQNQLLILLAEAEPLSGIIGFAKVFRLEMNIDNIKCFFIMDETAPSFDIDHPTYKEQICKDMFLNVFRHGEWCSYCPIPYVMSDIVHTPHAYVNVLEPGHLNTLKWIAGPLDPNTYESEPDKTLIHVYFAALNSKDIREATKRTFVVASMINRHQECSIGYEFSGKTNDGRRFMGLKPSMATASLVECDSHHLWPVNDTWTLEEAATIPFAYATVLYALLECGRMKKYDSILIHSAADGIGLAALNVCLHYECTIFLTVDNLQKRKFILEHFPNIPERNIGDSGDMSFEQLIKNETEGRGVDLVLNSLDENKLKASLRCLTENGRFLELGKNDFSSNLHMQSSYKKVTIIPVDITLFFVDKRTENTINVLMKEAMAAGVVKPLSRVIFAVNELETAYRCLADGENIGKVLIKFREEEPSFDCSPSIQYIPAIPRYLCDANKSYVICGGLGGFGLELANWLVSRGARNLILNSRRMPHNGYQVSRIRLWRSYGVCVIISTDDISTEKGVTYLLQRAISVGPVAGIFNAAAALSDNLFHEQTEQSFKISAGPKISATFHLDNVSRRLCPQLEYFVVFSSITTVFGSVGVTNYAMSNSTMERICEKRKADNLPALAILWGMIGDVGIFPEKLHFGKDVMPMGWAQQSIHSCLQSLENLILQSNPLMICGVVGKKNAQEVNNETVPQTIARILGLKNMAAINMYTTLSDFGMDSLANVEIRNVLNRFQFDLSDEEIRKLTFARLYEMETEFNQRLKKNNKTDETQEEGEINDLAYTLMRDLIETADKRQTTVIRMASLLHNGDTKEVSAQEYPTLFFMPGLDGYGQYSAKFASELNVQVLCLEYDYRNVADTIEEQCQPLVKEIEKRLQPDKEFWLAGFSFGVVMALEATRQLEEAGRHGRTWLIDADLELSEITETGGEKLIIELAKNGLLGEIETPLFRLVWPETIKLVKEIIDNSNSFEEIDSRLRSAIDPEMLNKWEWLHEYWNAVSKRFKAYALYKRLPRKSIASQVTLLKASESPRKLGQTLSQYLQRPLITHIVEGDHFTILKNKSASSAINEDLRKLFSNGNP